MLIYKELKFLNIYKLGGGDGINTSLAAGLRLVVKVSLVYVFEASIITLSFLLLQKYKQFLKRPNVLAIFFERSLNSLGRQNRAKIG